MHSDVLALRALGWRVHRLREAPAYEMDMIVGDIFDAFWGARRWDRNAQSSAFSFTQLIAHAAGTLHPSLRCCSLVE